jgi:hypothetical protein
MAKLTGTKINRELDLGAELARYHEKGSWYDQLHKFPGILADLNGYVTFEDLKAYQRCPQLRHPNRERLDGRPGTLTVPGGISSIPNYIRDGRIATLKPD